MYWLKKHGWLMDILFNNWVMDKETWLQKPQSSLIIFMEINLVWPSYGRSHRCSDQQMAKNSDN